MRKVLSTALLLLVVAALCTAALPRGEKKVTSDGNVTVTGSSEVELLADGEARVTIRYAVGDSTVAAPAAATGDTSFTIVSGVPRAFNGLNLRYVYVDLVDASYVIVTWR